MDDAPIGSSYVSVATDDYNLAEIASGFNRTTYMSPIHAALLPLIMVNEGELIFPRLVNSITNSNSEVVWRAKKKARKIVDKNTAEVISNMMKATVEFGTARRGFRKFKKDLKSKLDLGGKTGSITGGVPFGKRDWFVAFAKPKDSEQDKGISLCIMNVNKKIWRAKSTRLAKEIIEYYYSRISPLI
jgi:cell division protein FtsI/penicillin-binding protein 2